MAPVTGTPRVESFDVKLNTDLSFPDFQTRSHHPYNPWGPITKFYVLFTIRPVAQFCFHAQSRSEYHALPSIQNGVVLARSYDGRGNLCIWEGQVIDVVLHVAGITPNLAKSISRTLHDRIVTVPKAKEIVEVHVEMDVVTPYIVKDDGVLDLFSVPAVSMGLRKGDCGICDEPLGRELVVRRGSCSHFFHDKCLACLVDGVSRVCPVCRVEFRLLQENDVNTTLTSKHRRKSSNESNKGTRRQRKKRRFKTDDDLKEGMCGFKRGTFPLEQEHRGCEEGLLIHKQRSLLVSSEASSSHAKQRNVEINPSVQLSLVRCSSVSKIKSQLRITS